MEYSYLENIKKMLGITGSYQDDILDGYAEEAIAYMVDAGIDEDTARGEKAVGVVARGVSDLWNYGSGEAHLSDYFRERVVQLSYKVKNNPDPGDEEEVTLRLIVTVAVTVDEDTQTPKITADKTYEEIKAAWEAGSDVVVLIDERPQYEVKCILRLSGVGTDFLQFYGIPAPGLTDTLGMAVSGKWLTVTSKDEWKVGN